MPADVSDRPPRQGPISRYFIPLKAFSSGLEDSAVSESTSVGDADDVVCVASLGFAAVAAFDCRSGLVWACTAVVNEIKRESAKTNRGARDALLRMLSGPMFKVLRGRSGQLAMVIGVWLCCKGQMRSFGVIPSGAVLSAKGSIARAASYHFFARSTLFAASSSFRFTTSTLG